MAGASLLVWRRADFAKLPTANALAMTVLAGFVFLFVLEHAIFAVVSAIGRAVGDPILAPRSSRVKLSLRTLQIGSMCLLTALGLEAHELLGGFAVFSPLKGAVAVSRALAYDPLCCRLSLCQLSYQLYNTYVSIRDRDGPVFVGHHMATGMVCVLSLAPFLHHFAPFFLGLSEFSTALLCVLAPFDKGEGGVPGMSERFPVTKQVLGVVFAIAFVVTRIVVWPWMSYVFWLDVLAVLEAQAHSSAVCYVFLVTNAGLSVLQVFWMAEIVRTAIELFGPQPKVKAV